MASDSTSVSNTFTRFSSGSGFSDMSPPVISALRSARQKRDLTLRLPGFVVSCRHKFTLQRWNGGQHPNCNESLNSGLAGVGVDRSSVHQGAQWTNPSEVI